MRGLPLLAIACLALGCGGASDGAGADASTANGSASVDGGADGPGGGAVEPGDSQSGSTAPGGAAGSDAGSGTGDEDETPTVDDLAARLDAIPEGMEPGFDEEGRQEGDPELWTPIRTIGGQPVETLREYDPNSGLLLRIATTRPADDAAAAAPRLHGPEWRYHETGSQRSVQWWRDDVPHGLVRQWRRVGVLAREGRFDQGQRDGLWREYAKNGQLVTQSIYARGALVGSRQSWFPSGQPNYAEQYENGKLSGRRQVWDRAGILVLDEAYQDGELHGRWSDFHPSDGDPREWGTYEHGVRVGQWQRGSASGVVLATVQYEAGVLQGEARTWSDNGNLIEECVYEDGQKTGPSRTWFADGTPQSEGRLENGRRVGRWTYWKSDGSLNDRWSGLYEDDRRVASLDGTDQ
ncbi:MAG: hypothetical protein AAF726_24710 [Planctomycetota bacterium]